MKETEIILYDSPEACTQGVAKFDDGTELVVYKAVRGIYKYIGADENAARFTGCTHKTCPETGEVFEKSWIDGPTVRNRKRREAYLACKQEARGFPIFVEDEFFGDLDELVEYYCDLEDFSEIGGEIFFAGKGALREIDADDIYGNVPTEVDIDPSPGLIEALNALNALIRVEDPGWYEASKVRPTDEQVAEWNAAICEARKQTQVEL